MKNINPCNKCKWSKFIDKDTAECKINHMRMKPNFINESCNYYEEEINIFNLDTESIRGDGNNDR